MINIGYSKVSETKIIRISRRVTIRQGMTCGSIAQAFSHVPGPLVLKAIEDTDNDVTLLFIEERDCD